MSLFYSSILSIHVDLIGLKLNNKFNIALEVMNNFMRAYDHVYNISIGFKALKKLSLNY